MTPEEIEIQIAELEDRVDRLRALYEQYFMGIEKVEPTVLRKDVDRRFWVLRREQIRNTALRFKLQMIVQRYNTFQQYWARICRDIENGTYHRDVARAAERFGEAAAQTALGRKRQKMFEKGMAKQAEREAARMARTAQDPAPESQPQAPEPRASSPSLAPPALEPKIPAPLVARASRPQATQAFQPLELDMDDEFGDLAPPATGQRSFPPSEAPTLVRGETPTVSKIAPPPRPPVDSEAPTQLRKPTLPEPPTQLRHAVVPATPRPPAAPPSAPGTAAPPPSATRPQAPARPAVDPFHRNPFAQAKPAEPPPRPGPRPVPAPGGGELSDHRLRQIYSQYVEAKRQCRESTASVTYDSLAKSLRESAPKLKAKHNAKAVDFEVVIKDGKTVLKPVLKG